VQSVFLLFNRFQSKY